ncbi:MAG: BamA/TamA family outer membrane protein, partial [Ignavibacteria bacterium]
MKHIFRISLFVFLSSIVSFSQSQNDSSDYTKRTLRMIPGKEYEAGWFHELFFGVHWRDLWTTPVKAEVLDFENFAGGLTPTKRGGGLQTKSLRFKGNDGREYKFRSVNKDPKKVLDKELQESIAADIIQDQISSANPYAPLVVAPLLTAVGVLQAVPKLVVLPDDEKLGKFRKDFGGILGMIEISPEEEDIEGSDKIVGTIKLMERLDKNHDETVDSREYLKARLMDIYFGDWDRHKDQWKWARFEENGKKIYKPIPRDRDQAFSEFDGLLPSIGEFIVPQLNHFGAGYPKMKFMTWSGRYLDQRFLPFLDKGSWDSVTNFVYEKLTDYEIENAVKQLPIEVYSKAKVELEEKLKSRRNQLKKASNEYYKLVNSVTDVFSTDKRDYIEINSVNDKTEISIYKRNKETGEKEGEALHYKMFENDITDELRIYLKDGDDKIIITGKDNGSPLLRIIGGDGGDELIDNSDINIILHDDGKKTKVKKGASTNMDKDKFKEPQDSLEKYLSKNE